ncbi:MAG: N-acetylneuraminate synthase family protein [Nanoarchaeota archaeon]
MKIAFNIEDRQVGPGNPVLIIAEAGVNHEGSLESAIKLVDAAADAGADIVKFQTFSADKIIVKKAKMAKYQQENLKSTQSQYALLKSLEIDASFHKKIKDYCKLKGIIFQSTPHSNKWSVDLLRKLGVSSYKVGSGDLTNIPHLKNIARLKKPMIVSTGMAVMDEIEEAVHAITAAGNDQLILLHCTTDYPCPYEEVNLSAMLTIQKSTGISTGYSDHTMGILVPLLAVFYGACTIEKHVTLDRTIKNPKSPDHKASLEPDEFTEMVQAIRFMERQQFSNFKDCLAKLKKNLNIDLTNAYQQKGLDASITAIMGDGIKRPQPSEQKIRGLVRKSIIAIKPIRKGEKFSEKNIDILRPEGGLHPREWDKVITQGHARKALKPEMFVTKEDVSFKKK